MTATLGIDGRVNETLGITVELEITLQERHDLLNEVSKLERVFLT
jgi:hypothetical protein